MKNKIRFYELILNCPFNDPTDECVFEPYRTMSLIELIEFRNPVNSEKISYLLEQHSECCKKRNQRKIAG